LETGQGILVGSSAVECYIVKVVCYIGSGLLALERSNEKNLVYLGVDRELWNGLLKCFGRYHECEWLSSEAA